MRTLNAYLLIFAAVVIFACSSNEEDNNRNLNWRKIEVDDHGAVYAVYGDVNKYLLVSVYGRIHKSEDGGKTWNQVFDAVETVGHFFKKNDTLFAVTNSQDFYSLDEGDSWEMANSDLVLSPIDELETQYGTRYKIHQDFEGELALPSEIFRSTTGGQWENIFPYQHYIFSIYLDENKGLYVGIASSFEWNTDQGLFEENLENKSALYYLEN